MDEYVGRLEDYEPGGQTWILDRWHIGETVWPHIFDRKTSYTPFDFVETEQVLHNLGALIVYAERDDHDTWAKELEEHDEPINGETGREAKELFEISLAKCLCPVQRYNYADWDRRLDFIPLILGRAAYEERRVLKEMNHT